MLATPTTDSCCSWRCSRNLNGATRFLWSCNGYQAISQSRLHVAKRVLLTFAWPQNRMRFVLLAALASLAVALHPDYDTILVPQPPVRTGLGSS
jgi:hypothetical protein